MIKITHIITGLAPDGAERMLYKLVSGLDSEEWGNEVISLTDLGPIAEKIQGLGVQVRALGMSRGVPNPFYLLRLTRWLRVAQPTVIQTWMYHADLIGGLSAKLAGYSAIVWNIRHSHLEPGIDKRRTLWTAQACARLSRQLPTRIVCCSEISREVHAKLGYAQDKMEVIPNGFDLESFKPDPDSRAAVRKELGIPREDFLIGLIGRFHPVKGHRNFVEAAGRIRCQFPQVQFLLCGEGITRENTELAKWIESAGIGAKCHLLGKREDIPRLLNALDVATSASFGEGFPNVIGEAMACGVPCVVTDVGDSALIVGDTGLVVPPQDSRALAQAWYELLVGGPKARLQLGQAARRRVEQNYGLTAIIQRYRDLYRQVAEEASRWVSPSRLAQIPG